MNTIVRRNVCNFVTRAKLAEKIRNDDSHCKAALKRSNAKIVAFSKGRPLISDRRREPHWTPANGFNAPNATQPVFLGLDEDAALFASSVDDQDFVKPENCQFVSSKIVLFRLKDQNRDFPLITKAISLLSWHRKTRYCSACGSWALTRTASGHRISCDDCRRVFYPSPSPVGIVLIENSAGDKILLVRGKGFPEGLFSCVAGFVDCGESLEEAVRREVAEEVGLKVGRVSTRGLSHHWPFPGLGSFMVGCFAKISPDEPDESRPEVDPNEVAEAKWFDRPQILLALEPGKEAIEAGFFVPPKNALAHHLISEWANAK